MAGLGSSVNSPARPSVFMGLNGNWRAAQGTKAVDRMSAAPAIAAGHGASPG